MRWNDVSVNENGHLHALLRLTRECGVLDGFADEERRACRATLGRLVLSTDMAHHAKLLEDFVDAATDAMETASMNAAAIDENGNEEEEVASVASWSDPVLALCYVLHCADISNPARLWRLAREWGARISEEFYKQGDRERALGVPVAALNDRYAAGATNAAATTAANQIAFARYVVEPTLEGLMTIAPGAVEVMLDRLRENTAKYARVVAGETVGSIENVVYSLVARSRRAFLFLFLPRVVAHFAHARLARVETPLLGAPHGPTRRGEHVLVARERLARGHQLLELLVVDPRVPLPVHQVRVLPREQDANSCARARTPNRLGGPPSSPAGFRLGFLDRRELRRRQSRRRRGVAP